MEIGHITVEFTNVDIDEVRDHNADIFKEYFTKWEQWSEDYVASDDYANDYAYLMNEGIGINDSLERILKPDIYRHSYQGNRSICGLSDDAKLPKTFVEEVAERILFNNLYESRLVDEYASESNFYLDSFYIGEHENQIELSHIENEVSKDLWQEYEGQPFIDALVEWLSTQRDFCINWKYCIHREHGSLYLITYIGSRIDFVTNADSLETATTEVIIRYCQQHDENRKTI
jgi:hypothetical protein